MKNLYIIIVVLFTSFAIHAQTCSNTVYSNDGGNNGVSIKKCYSVSSPIQTGRVFNYVIDFTTQGSVGTITIQDILGSNLIPAGNPTQPSWLSYNSISKTWTGIPPTGSFSYNITFPVRFENGTTCDGTIGTNKVSILASNIPKVTTNEINIEAEAIDDWSISKTAVRVGKTFNQNIAGDNVVVFNIAINGGGSIGRHGLSNITIQDIIPGAIVQTGGCFNLNGSYLAPNGRRCQITVIYPSSIFPNDQIPCPTNTIRLTGTNPCGDLITIEDTETICFKSTYVPIITPGAKASKYVNISNPVPGCTGYYNFAMYNYGTKDISDLILEDTFPTGITIDKFTIRNLSNNNYQYSFNGINWLPTSGTNLPNLTISPIPATFTTTNKILIRAFPGTKIKANSKIEVTANFTVDSGVSIGTVISNTVYVNSILESITSQATADFTIEPYQPKLRIRKSICNDKPNSIYEPGDELVYRMQIYNSGSAVFTGGILSDILDPKLQYLGNSNVRVYSANGTPNCSNNGVLDPSTTDLTSASTINFNTLNNELKVNIPSINAGCQITSKSVWVEFRVKVKPGVKSGYIPNKATISNGILNKTSNEKRIIIKELYTLKLSKYVSVDGVTYTNSTSIIPAGSQIKYKIDIENVGNNSMKDIKLIDILPNLGDKNIPQGNNRNSDIGGLLLNPIVVPTGFKVYYSNSLLPNTINEFGLTPYIGTTSALWTQTFNANAKSLKITSNNGYTINPLDIVSIIIDYEIPFNATVGDMLCNQAALRSKSLNNIDTNVQGSNLVCIEVEAPEIPNCCQTDLQLHDKIINIDYANDYTKVNTVIDIGNPLPNIPITEVRIAMSDLNIIYNYEDCKKCIDNPAVWGSMDYSSDIGSGSNRLIRENSNVSTFNQEGFREVIWKNKKGRMMQIGDKISFRTFLPSASSIPCCATEIEICYTISWKDANCNVCEKVLCQTISLEGKKKAN